MNNKIRIARLIMTALIISLAAILTALAPRNAEAAPPQASWKLHSNAATPSSPPHDIPTDSTT